MSSLSCSCKLADVTAPSIASTAGDALQEITITAQRLELLHQAIVLGGIAHQLAGASLAGLNQLQATIELVQGVFDGAV